MPAMATMTTIIANSRPLDRFEVWQVGREAFEPEPAEEVSQRLGGLSGWPSVPDHYDPAKKVLPRITEEVDLLGVEVATRLGTM